MERKAVRLYGISKETYTPEEVAECMKLYKEALEAARTIKSWRSTLTQKRNAHNGAIYGFRKEVPENIRSLLGNKDEGDDFAGLEKRCKFVHVD